MVFSNKALSVALIFICLIGTSISAHDWVNHIQERLSDAQIRRDVKTMHKQGMNVQQTIEAELRAQHTKILKKIRTELELPDSVWQETMQEIADWRQSIQATLCSKDNIHNFEWVINQEDIKREWQDPEERKLRNNIRIITKNALIDYGINQKNINMCPLDDEALSYYKEQIEQEQSWWQQQLWRLTRGISSWWHSFNPIGCKVTGTIDKPECIIFYNISSVSYFEPVELRALMGHEITHLLEGHHKEQELFAQLAQDYSKINKETWKQLYQTHELMADQLPALKSFIDAQKAADAMHNSALYWPVTTFCIHPLMDYFLPQLSTHPWTVYRRRALKNITQYLAVEQEINSNASSVVAESPSDPLCLSF